MAFAVSLLLDAGVSEAVAARWQRLADARLSRSMLELGYQPHVTLAVFDHLDTTHAAVALDDVFKSAARFAVTLTGVATFGPGSGVAYAALAPSPKLIDLHAAVLAAIGETCRPHYQAGRWTPHCTLATSLSDADAEQAQRLLAEGWPLSGSFVAADFVEFTPVAGIKRWTLGPAADIKRALS
jgi:2'-5' RNA ligase